jgi:hypothetical protein
MGSIKRKEAKWVAVDPKLFFGKHNTIYLHHRYVGSFKHTNVLYIIGLHICNL